MNYSLKNLVLKTLCWVNALSFIILACCIDSFTSCVPYIIMFLNEAFLGLMVYANFIYKKGEN